MLSRYHESFYTPTTEILNSLGFFGDVYHKHKSDVIDSEGIKVELPGVKSSDVEITVEGRLLKVTAKSRLGKEFSYTYSLRSAVDESAIEAHFEDGLLEVKLPKKQELKSRKIPIK
jgi:HSP20 family molecular chaperone IbpA